MLYTIFLGSGIGRASWIKLAQNGAKVVAVDFNQTTGEETLVLIREHGGDGVFIQAYGLAVYSASKHAMIGLTKSAALEYVKKGIRINAICSGGVYTTLTQAVPLMIQETGYVPEEFPNMRMIRFADPSEIAEMVVFLASNKSSYMTGSVIVVYGGLKL
nr:SDR family oxidoreductase [Bacillus sp. FJAT-28004]